MAEFTIGERLLLHLYTYRSVNPEDYFNIPWDLTQDGISTSLRISRAHASIELKKQKEKGNVNETLVRIQGGKVRRLAYSLNEKGLRAAMEVEEKARNAGVDVRTLLDMKKQDPVKVLDGLTPGDRFALGVACAFRLSVPLDVLPPHDRSVIPADVLGHTTIVPELRNKLFSAADPEEMRYWHNYVANYYDEKGPHSVIEDEDCRSVEIAYHLLRAGRFRDACKVIERNLYNMMLSDDKEFYEAVRDIPDSGIKERHLLDVLTLRAELALSHHDLKTARESSERLIETEGGEEYGFACLTECLILRKLDKEARQTASQINGSGNAYGMLKLAEVYLDLGDIDASESQLAEAVKIISDNNEAAVSQRFLIQARIDVARGRIDDGTAHLSKAYYATNEIGRRNVKAVGKSLGLKVRDLTGSCSF